MSVGREHERAKEAVVSFPWEPAIPQAMQQHGGRNRTAVRRSAAVGEEVAATPVVTEGPALAPVDQGAIRASAPAAGEGSRDRTEG